MWRKVASLFLLFLNSANAAPVIDAVQNLDAISNDHKSDKYQLFPAGNLVSVIEGDSYRHFDDLNSPEDKKDENPEVAKETLVSRNGNEPSANFAAPAEVGVQNAHDLANIATAKTAQININVCDGNTTKNHMIYCSGDLLKAVNIHKIFADSKTFVDMPLKQDPDVVDRAFHRTFNTSALDAIDPKDLKKFLETYFFEAESELEECELKDWSSHPPRIMGIRDPQLREWALELNGIWKKLCRKIKPGLNLDRHSIIHVPNEFVVPGGRFREFYYWDTYWIIKGLLVSGMYNTSKSMLLNFRHVVEKYGFIPNGGRVYYLGRSQPPMLAPMVYQYYEQTHDIKFLRHMLPILEKELTFWHTRRKFEIRGPKAGETYHVFFYHTESNVPRPESYREDISVAKEVSDSLRPQLYRDLASAAESGWDFSTRWFGDKKSMSKIRTTKIAPIDLNALLCWNMQILEYFYRKLNEPEKAKTYSSQRQTLKDAMRHVFYNTTMRAWFDFDIELRTHNLDFTPAIAVPLFGECYQPLDLEKPQGVFDFMNNAGVFNYAGGIPTSLARDGKQQWDFPNGFPPLQHMVIEGMRKSGNPQTQEQAIQIAQRWVEGNYKVYKATGCMWEKYDVNGTVPKPGDGGEYAVQDGFGWTNGIILDLLTTYSNLLSLPVQDTVSSLHPKSSISAAPSSLYYMSILVALLHLVFKFS